jgi:hypothetical protein
MQAVADVIRQTAIINNPADFAAIRRMIIIFCASKIEDINANHYYSIRFFDNYGYHATDKDGSAGREGSEGARFDSRVAKGYYHNQS